ncbi:MAG: ATP-dependent metalloprotease FtsH, cell division protease FtsH [Microgenomates group bacterium GW2011_GWC1_43_13]|uniref:ATP-dependent zinc metalloprotease FtsH n=3 Tax=Candidatus Woeseibacteriota TaxID=1752722 RepID=A0A837IE11_9BACT|nr:MAG: ATP-dependent metalloprotease FtsH, cell division protease FtsH [Microgenomates group bacterium GW2011_GWC1_43_13]KKT33433.1 MAG: ATP-dependent zinc metalloprotease FtsH [Candidatus Woesebacteria bacterium GW2011_GWB1_44_11]KKT54858.1 MAG: ATP-dependent zinc metalloprotease FtsH [Candidatus Woesebacteria bacterium GW2011_GWA1_44_23]OGM76019.1 MAG: cell division protein FtsH [Candidatus Woesebacteria bacterium RIFOXYA1_FULL_43_16]OGM81977.1 MAG: cell division protein FtsH [Candidatus Woe
MDPRKIFNQNSGKKNAKGKKQFQFKLKVNLWTVALTFLVIFFVIPGIIAAFQTIGTSNNENISQILTDIKAGKVDKVTVDSTKLIVTYKDGGIKLSTKEDGESFSEVLKNSGIDPAGVNYEVVDQSLSKVMGNVLGIVLPILLMVGFFYFILKAQNKGAQDIFSFGRSRAKVFAKGRQNITFADVAGVDEAKKELEELVDFLKNPAKYRKIGARTPKGALLVGPSGVGKTLLAKAVAGEAGVPFFSMAGSEFMEMLVGVGASRARDLFAQAKASAPSIIFIDEIDAIGRQRGKGLMGGHDEREQTLNQILVEMDGFTPNDNVIVIAATNRGDLLDPALLRPGRFDRRIILDMPDKEGRLAILYIHARGKKFAKGVDWSKIADRTVGFSGADLENMLNEAAIGAARDNNSQISMADLEESATKVKLGPAKKRLQSDEDKKLTAYHEAGHAIVTHFLKRMDPVHRISIVARGMSLGHTLIPPAGDRTHETKSRLLEQIVAMLGGRAAEEVVFNEMTSGAANDIAQATKIARAMVVEFGMSDLGPINLGPDMGLGDFGQMEWYEQAQNSPVFMEKIDAETKSLLDSGYKAAVKLVKEKRKLLDKISNALLEKETLDRDDFEKIVGVKKVV